MCVWKCEEWTAKGRKGEGERKSQYGLAPPWSRNVLNQPLEEWRGAGAGWREGGGTPAPHLLGKPVSLFTLTPWLGCFQTWSLMYHCGLLVNDTGLEIRKPGFQRNTSLADREVFLWKRADTFIAIHGGKHCFHPEFSIIHGCLASHPHATS